MKLLLLALTLFSVTSVYAHPQMELHQHDAEEEIVLEVDHHE
jgi:hypothetical protein